MTRTAWFSAKFVLHHPIIATMLAQLTTSPAGKWNWMPNKRAFRTVAASLIAKKKSKQKKNDDIIKKNSNIQIMIPTIIRKIRILNQQNDKCNKKRHIDPTPDPSSPPRIKQ